jgi:mannose-6-phosphate isomerase-like protein (cupin superfamily)
MVNAMGIPAEEDRMAGVTRPTFDLLRTYVHLEDGGGATPVEVGEDFWARLHDRHDLNEGRLVCVFHVEQPSDWQHWEMHPAGEEIVALLSGAVDLVLQHGGVERVVELRDRRTCIVARGTWHRGIARQPSDLLFITPGKGTQHRGVCNAG